MARTTRTISDLEARAKFALAGLEWFDPRDLPAKFQNAAGYRALLQGLAKDGNKVDKAYMSARQAVEAWHAGQQLYEKAARLYHSPAVRAIANNDEATMLHYWNNPDEAMKILARHSVKFPRSYTEGPLREVMETIGEFQSFSETHEDSGSEPAAHVPQTPVAREAVPSPGTVPTASTAPSSGRKPEPRTYEELVAARTLTPSQWSRLMAEAERRHPEDDSSYAPPPVAQPGAGSPSRNRANEEWASAVATHERANPPGDEPI
jgi:hypothetical protein